MGETKWLFTFKIIKMNGPTTILSFTDHTPIPFGKYKGKAMVNIPAHYLLWLYNQGCNHEGVRKYIQENLDALNKEIQNTRK